jgi:hypothetical protein
VAGAGSVPVGGAVAAGDDGASGSVQLALMLISASRLRSALALEKGENESRVSL